MANGINNKEQNVIEFSPISVYGEQKEDNVLVDWRLVARM